MNTYILSTRYAQKISFPRHFSWNKKDLRCPPPTPRHLYIDNLGTLKVSRTPLSKSDDIVLDSPDAILL